MVAGDRWEGDWGLEKAFENWVTGTIGSGGGRWGRGQAGQVGYIALDIPPMIALAIAQPPTPPGALCLRKSGECYGFPPLVRVGRSPGGTLQYLEQNQESDRKQLRGPKEAAPLVFDLVFRVITQVKRNA